MDLTGPGKMNDGWDTKKEDLEKLRSMSVLFVEDEEIVRTEHSRALRRRCREVYEAADGQAGLEQFIRHNPDVVVTDIEMPRLNGIKMINKILEITPVQPVIIITGYDDDKHRSDKACVNMLKPVLFEDLLRAIVKCAGKRGTQL
ncbi:MAG: response regulator [Nitrospirae bacterium]|nr:response regulator [Nitrospirota bacterium]